MHFPVNDTTSIWSSCDHKCFVDYYKVIDFPSFCRIIGSAQEVIRPTWYRIMKNGKKLGINIYCQRNFSIVSLWFTTASLNPFIHIINFPFVETTGTFPSLSPFFTQLFIRYLPCLFITISTPALNALIAEGKWILSLPSFSDDASTSPCPFTSLYFTNHRSSCIIFRPS